MTDGDLDRPTGEVPDFAGWVLGLLLVVTTWLVMVGLVAVAWVVIR